MFPNEQREHNDAHRRVTQALTLAVKGDLSGLSVVETVSPQVRPPRGLKVMKQPPTSFSILWMCSKTSWVAYVVSTC